MEPKETAVLLVVGIPRFFERFQGLSLPLENIPLGSGEVLLTDVEAVLGVKEVKADHNPLLGGESYQRD